MLKLLPFVFLSTLCVIPCVAADRPNVVVIMADDLGFSDVGCYGGEIETPNLDQLAAGGVRFAQFYNTAKCHSSRVSLLTGQYCLAAGDTAMNHAVTSAEVLSKSGYFTAMTGKWHLDQQPTDFGFDRYFGHLSGACNYFSGDNSFRLNGEPWKVPEENFYTTVANIDFALDFLNEARASKKPWYLYVAFNAPHAPLHALPQDYAKYKGRYEKGWDVIREARIAKQKSLGVFDNELVPSDRPEHVPAWIDLPDWQKGYEANRMTTLAAMIDRLDQEVGRLISDLKRNGELDNTLILFVSDNGACPYDRQAPRLNVEPTNAETSLADSTGWAWARNSPFRYYKQNQFEGGISSPAIMHWPNGIKRPAGSFVREPAHLIDVLPTLSDITSSPIPEQFSGRQLRPTSGVSLKPILNGESLKSRPPIHLLFAKDRGLRDGDWKLVSFQGEAWELYHVSQDRTELNDLAKVEPERLKQMIATWNDMTNRVLHASAATSSPVKEASLPHRHREWTNFALKRPEDFTRGKQRAESKGDETLTSNSPATTSIRARKNTSLKIVGQDLQLQFSGEDPGIAIDLRGKALPDGPYKLSFGLIGGSKDGGELYFTTDLKTTLPNGQRQTFDVSADGHLHQICLDIVTKKRLQQFRLDVCNGTGQATISKLTLLDGDDNVLVSWPEAQSPKRRP
ncbi:MAG: arylsulfatase [Planctomycetaceae bacterium]